MLRLGDLDVSAYRGGLRASIAHGQPRLHERLPNLGARGSGKGSAAPALAAMAPFLQQLAQPDRDPQQLGGGA